MPDEIIEELWRAKDSIAREQGNDVRKLAAYLQGSNPEDPLVSEDTSADDVLIQAPGQRLLKTVEARALRGTGWEGDLDEMRSDRTT